MYEEYDQQVLNSIEALKEQASLKEIQKVMSILIDMNPRLLKDVSLIRHPLTGVKYRRPVWQTLDYRLRKLRNQRKIAYNAKTNSWRIIHDT